MHRYKLHNKNLESVENLKGSVKLRVYIYCEIHVSKDPWQ